MTLPIQGTHNIYDKRYTECGLTLPPNLVAMNRARQQKPRLRRSTPRPTPAGYRFQQAIFASKYAATVSAPSLILLIVRHMTAWPNLVVGDLLGGISQVLGTPPPLTPSPHDPPPGDPRAHLTGAQRAALQYMGIDPDTAPMEVIDRALAGSGNLPLFPPPPAPAPGPPAPDAPTVPGSGPPAEEGLSGAAAEAAKRLDAALEKNRSALNEADQKLADAILAATSSSEQGKAQLQQLQQSIIDQVTKLGPTLDTSAGQQQLADFLQGKTSDITSVLKNAGLDSASQSAVLDGLTARYDALSEAKTGDGGDGEKAPTGAAGTPPGAPAPAGTAPTGAAGDTSPAGLTGDPMLDGLASDPLLSGLGSMLGPGMGALGSPPGMMGGMMPMGGGGLPLGDIGSGIGSAIRGGTDAGKDSATDPAGDLKDPALGDKHGGTEKSDDDGAVKDPPAGAKPETKPAGTEGATPPQEVTAGTGQVAPTGQPAPVDTTVKLPNGATVTTDSAALAKAGRAVLEGMPVDDAYRQAGINLSPAGAPVTAPVSPSRLVFGDIGQFTDHRVMALGDNKVWVNGQVSPLEQLQTGPNFLGWEHPAAPAPAQTVVTTSATAPADPQVSDQTQQFQE